MQQPPETDLNFDQHHLWHPYTSLENPLPVYPVRSAEGCNIILEDGTPLIDGMASWWCMIHGYNHPRLNQAITKQLDSFAHVMFGGLTHEPATSLGKLLIKLTPPALQQVFFCDSGSVSVEVAIKMAMQYWMSKGKVSRTRLISLQHAYHGDTFAAMSVCDPVNGMHDKFAGLLLDVHFLPAPAAGFGLPHDENQIAELRAYLEKEHSHCAALILEPIVQGAGGMRFYSPDYLKAVREVCSEFGILLIADEIATGFGRTGKLFACEHAGISPDIMCVGKALTGGYMSLAATLCTNEVSRSISMHNTPLMHGPTFMANPLACACAIASIELLLESPWQERIEAISEQLENGLAACRQEESVEDVRVLGAIGVVEMKQEVDMAAAQAFFVSKGVWIRPFGRLIYVMPPYLIDGKSLQKLADAILEFTRTLAIR